MVECPRCGYSKSGLTKDHHRVCLDCGALWPRQPTVHSTWELWTYDVWGNAKDGYEVNDRSCFDRSAELTLSTVVHNLGTPQAFVSANPTDRQIKKLFGVNCRIETDGDDIVIYVNRARDGYPIGEMICTHKR
jgi:hypothetical protein